MEGSAAGTPAALVCEEAAAGAPREARRSARPVRGKERRCTPKR
jgi:hypothetical protein